MASQAHTTDVHGTEQAGGKGSMPPWLHSVLFRHSLLAMAAGHSCGQQCPEQPRVEERVSEVRLRGAAVEAASQVGAAVSFLPRKWTFLLFCHAAKPWCLAPWHNIIGRPKQHCQPFTVIMLAVSPALQHRDGAILGNTPGSSVMLAVLPKEQQPSILLSLSLKYK